MQIVPQIFSQIIYNKMKFSINNLQILNQLYLPMNLSYLRIPLLGILSIKNSSHDYGLNYKHLLDHAPEGEEYLCFCTITPGSEVKIFFLK